VEAVEALGIGMLADLREKEEVGGFVDEVGVLAGDVEGVGAGIENGEGFATEIEVAFGAVAIDDVAGGVDGGFDGRDGAIVRGAFVANDLK
jgi:hypothetical protein